MIKAHKGNVFDYLEKENIDTLFNAANGIGPMGCGIAGAIRKHGGMEIQEEAIRVCATNNPLPGEAYVTGSGKLSKYGVSKIIHAVTMRNPGGITSYGVVEKAFKSALVLSKNLKSHIICCTALGTGVGGLSPIIVAKIMYNTALYFSVGLDIIFIDLDEQFINSLGTFIEKDMWDEKYESVPLKD